MSIMTQNLKKKFLLAKTYQNIYLPWLGFWIEESTVFRPDFVQKTPMPGQVIIDFELSYMEGCKIITL